MLPKCCICLKSRVASTAMTNTTNTCGTPCKYIACVNFLTLTSYLPASLMLTIFLISQLGEYVITGFNMKHIMFKNEYLLKIKACVWMVV